MHDGKRAETDARTTAVAPPQEVVGQVSRDGLGNEVFDVKCYHCKTRLRAPWVGAGVVRCGVCKELLQLKRPDGACATDRCGHGHSKMRTGLGGYQDPAQCICDKIFFFCPAAATFYFAIVLTSLITIGSFVLVAPRLFPNPDTPVGMLLWVLVVYIAMNTFANFYWGASIDPGKPPTDLTSRTRTEKGEDASTGTGDGDAKDGWCYKCDAEKPEGTHHCSRCKRCVYRMVHPHGPPDSPAPSLSFSFALDHLLSIARVHMIRKIFLTSAPSIFDFPPFPNCASFKHTQNGGTTKLFSWITRFIYIYVYIYVYIHICINACICMYTHTHIHSYVYMHIYIYTYVHI